MDYQEFKAKTVDDAITQACLKYGVASDRLDYTVVEEGRTGFIFGIGSRDAIIKARVKKPVVDKAKKEIDKVKAEVENVKKSIKAEKPAQKKSEKKADTAAEEKSQKVEKAAEKVVEKASEKKAQKTDEKNVQKSEKKQADKKADRTGDRPERKNDKSGRKQGRNDRAEKKADESAETFEKIAPVAAAAEGSVQKSAGGIITADEIEKRAAAAAARAKAEGVEIPESTEREERPRRRDKRDRRDRRGGKNRKFSDRYAASAGEEVSAEAAEKQHKPSQPKPERVVLPKTEEEVAEMKETARTFLENIFRCMGINVDMTMEYDQKEGCLGCTFAGEEMGILIGKRGQTLDSLQYLTSLVINKNKSDYTRVKLDTEDYRARRADTLENLSRNIAYKVKRSRRPVALEPMNPYERRIIHSSLQGNRYVETYSEGEEPYRHVVVAPKRQ